ADGEVVPAPQTAYEPCSLGERWPLRSGDDLINIRVALENAFTAGEDQHVHARIGEAATNAAHEWRREQNITQPPQRDDENLHGRPGSRALRLLATRRAESPWRARTRVSLSNCSSWRWFSSSRERSCSGCQRCSTVASSRALRRRMPCRIRRANI